MAASKVRIVDCFRSSEKRPFAERYFSMFRSGSYSLPTPIRRSNAAGNALAPRSRAESAPYATRKQRLRRCHPQESPASHRRAASSPIAAAMKIGTLCCPANEVRHVRLRCRRVLKEGERNAPHISCAGCIGDSVTRALCASALLHAFLHL